MSPAATMPSRLTAAELDAILALQLTVAWAGEAAGEPQRLAWWRSDLVDPEGGGDLFVRLVPKTAAWASLTLVREAARRTDEALRAKLGRGDSVWTLFQFGFAVDEQLSQKLRAMVPEYRLSKFQRALPDRWQSETVGAYMLDFEGTARFLGQGR